jgi:hypothetical protein
MKVFTNDAGSLAKSDEAPALDTDPAPTNPMLPSDVQATTATVRTQRRHGRRSRSR